MKNITMALVSTDKVKLVFTKPNSVEEEEEDASDNEKDIDEIA